MYKPTQASQLLNIPISSLRRLSAQFSAYLSPRKGVRREYTDRDIETLARARTMLEQGFTVVQVREQLSKVVISTPEEEERAPEPEPITSTSLVIQQLTTINKRYAALHEELETLKEERDKDRERLSRLEAWSRLPWWKRWFTAPPKQ